MEQRLKVVIVNEGVAYPPDAGNWLRTLNLMLPLARRHEITYVCRGTRDPAVSGRARAFYGDHGIRAIISDDYPAEKRGPAFYGHLAANVLSPLPYSISSHRSREVRRTLSRLASEEAVDLWQFETLSYADAPLRAGARTVVMAHNVETLIWERLHATEPRAHRRWYIAQQARKYARFEGRVLRSASAVVAVSAEDAALMRTRFDVRDPVVVDNGVDIARFAPGVDPPPRDPRQILFLGSLEWRPNIDSVDLLLSEIMPRVVAAEPNARLVIVGRKPSAALVRQVKAHRNVELHADVPDVRPFLARAGVLAVPLRIGGGSRLKILEAVAAGLPVVSTRVGCEGLLFTPGQDISVVEAPASMAEALVECIRNPERAAALAANGKAVIDQHYDWSRLAARLERVWLDTARIR